MDKNIVLIGFMGVGKSSVGRELSRALNAKFIDSDAEIEKVTRQKISYIFSRYGEDYFRDIESKIISAVALNSGAVISCGGGAVLRDKNVEALKIGGVIIELFAQTDVIFNRIKDSNRPLIKNGYGIEELNEMYKKRADKYLAAADYRIDTSFLPPEEIAKQIIKLKTK